MTHEQALKLLTPKDEHTAMIGLDSDSANKVKEHLQKLQLYAAGVEPCELTLAELTELIKTLDPNLEVSLRMLSLPRVMRTLAEALFIRGPSGGGPSDVARFRYVMKVYEETGRIPLKSG